MTAQLTFHDVARLTAEATAAVHHDPCRTCDCFLGYLTQLELDAADDVATLTTPLKGPRADIHSCLGCDPCPPGALFARYQRGDIGTCDGGGCECCGQ